MCTNHACYRVKLTSAKAAAASAAKKIVDGGRDPKKDPSVVPAYVSDSFLAEKVKGRKARGKAPAGGASRKGPKKGPSPNDWDHPRNVAGRKLDSARRERRRRCLDAAERAARKDPLVRAALTLLWVSPLCKKASPGLAAMLKRIAGIKKADAGALLVELAKSTRPGCFVPQSYGYPDGAAVMVAAAFGHDPGPEPKLADFLPANPAEKGKAGSNPAEDDDQDDDAGEDE